ncbi:MAG: amino acid ABC transporter permease [Lachnospiraceae bacterium]|nr:amino acid ABC transporter permease [Lachnospiraceae bacterium]MDY5741552.1 amino acid ABC transporter permease [Lachnospiraceae bacterium]
MDWLASVADGFHNAFIAKQYYHLYLKGLQITLLLSLGAVIIGVVIGTVAALVKVIAKQNKYLKPLEFVFDLYITIIRGTPVMLQLLILYNFIFVSRDSNPLVAGIIGFGINSGAYVAEIMRAGIAAVDKGQMEAGRSLGFSAGQTMRFIILPQALKNVLPALGNEFVSLIKETSVGSVITITDLTQVANMIGSRDFNVLPPLFIAAGFYLLLVICIQQLIKIMERRMAKSDRH